MTERVGLFAWIVGHPRGTLAIIAALIVVSIFGSGVMPTTFLPQIELPVVVVTTRFPGATAAEVESLVTIPVEDSLSSLEGLESSESMSRPGISVTRLTFDWGTNTVIAGVEVREAIDRIYPSLPSDLPRPQVYNVDPNDSPIGVVAVLPVVGRDLLLTRELAEREIRSALQKIEGVGYVTLAGGQRRRVEVRPDLDRLVSAGLTLETLARAIGSSAIDVPAGSVFQGDRELVLRTVAAPRSVSELRERTLPLSQGTSALSDLAAVSWAGAPQQSLFLSGSTEAIGLSLWPQVGADPVRTMERVREEVQRLGRSYASSAELRLVSDRSGVIEQSIASVLQAGLVGATVAALLVAAVLRRTTPSLVLTATLPVSIILALGALAAAGAGINVISLAGLSIGIGMLIDNAVVVVDNVQRMSGGPGSWSDRVARATAQMAQSIIGSTLTTVVVFVPLLMLPGILGAVFRELALAVAFALTASLVSSMTLVPALAALTRESWWSNTGGRWWRRTGIRIAAIAVRWRGPVIVTSAALLIVAITLLFLIPRLLFPAERSNEYLLRISHPSGTTFEAMKARQIELLNEVDFPREVAVFAQAGGEPDDPFYGVSPEERREDLLLRVILPPGASRALREATTDALERASAHSGGTLQTVTFGIDRVLDLPDGSRWVVQSPDRVAIEDLARLRRDSASATFPVVTQPRVTVLPIRDALAQAGIAASDLARAIQAALVGAPAGSLEEGGRRYGIVVLHQDAPHLSLDQITELPVTGSSGAVRPLEGIARVALQQTSAALYRIDRQAALVTDTVDEELASVYNVRRLGERQAQRYAVETLLVLGLSFVLLVLVLAAQFDSFTVPWLVVVTVPIAALGAVVALIAAGRPMSINSGLGLLVLLGLVVNNAIVLYDTFRRQIASSGSARGALRRTLRTRLRPIALTSLSTIVALIPQTGVLGGTETQHDLALTVLGGIVLSTLLTLLLIPAVLAVRSQSAEERG